MKMLLRGMENKRRVELLLSLTKINSESLQYAITDHLCNGCSEKDASILNGVQQQNFNRAMVKLNKVAGIVEEIKNEDWSSFKANHITDVK